MKTDFRTRVGVIEMCPASKPLARRIWKAYFGMNFSTRKAAWDRIHQWETVLPNDGYLYRATQYGPVKGSNELNEKAARHTSTSPPSEGKNWESASRPRTQQAATERKKGQGETLSYSEQDGQVVLTMSREDYEKLSILTHFAEARIHRSRSDDYQGMLNRLNEGNPNYTPYQVKL